MKILEQKQFANILTLKNQKKIVKNLAGRNNNGHITVRHKGGGIKTNSKNFYWSNFWKNNLVLFSEYNNKTNSFLNRMISFSNDSSKDAIFFYKQATTEDAFLKFQIKNFQKQLQFFEIGDYLNNISLLLKKNPVFARSSGSYGILLRKQSIKKDYVTVKLPSNKIRLIHREAFASPGQVSLSLIRTKKLYKAGQSRWLNIRPSVRGRAMNPVDHPHGGRTNGGRPSVSLWGRLTKGGVKTRKNKRTSNFIISNSVNLIKN